MGKPRFKQLPETFKPGRGNKINCRCTKCGGRCQRYAYELDADGVSYCHCCGGVVDIASRVQDCDLDREYMAIVAGPNPTNSLIPNAVQAKKPLSVLDDNYRMPFGKHSGKPLGDVATDYLEYIAFSPDDPTRSTKMSRCFKKELQAYLAVYRPLPESQPTR